MIAGINLLQLMGLLTASFFTILVLSYVIGDGPPFRMAIHVFIGVSAGYAAAVAIYHVLIPKFVYMTANVMQQPLLFILSLVSIVLLILKLSPRTAQLGNPVSAMLVGTGAAVAIAGAIQGTLLPQVGAAAAFFDPPQFAAALGQSRFDVVIRLLLQGSVLLVGTLSALVSFQFSAKRGNPQAPERHKLIEWIASMGRIFIAITLGMVFAGVYSAALAALIERFDFLMGTLDTLWMWWAG